MIIPAKIEKLNRADKVSALRTRIQDRGVFPVLSGFHHELNGARLKYKKEVWTYLLGLVCEAIRGLPQVAGSNIKVAPGYKEDTDTAFITAWPEGSEATHVWYSQPVSVNRFEIISAQYDWEGESLGI
ncbi:hypothetical protein [Paenibacillus tundrae]|uniref:Uncharacterized protein n=1 Tax=Paenibacillus tundrae TaxID=528187 RepID=A0ABT9W8G8_9BACL|nr:hypothetical protein [Paenibacillus tundrae]MDQ0169155.1 hypothetical protein [Paenibacillus tundrae]